MADTVLRLQRSAGNQAVARALLQRNGPGTTTEYVPEMSVKPDAQEAKIGQTFREQLKVLNWREAPRGTYFGWGGGPRDDALHFVGLPELDRHGTARLDAAPLRPGKSSVQANLVHQVPGGPQRTWMGPEIPVTTPTPELETVLVKGPPVRDGAVQWDRLAIGDQITMQVRVKNVDRRIGSFEQPSWASHMTSGVLDVVSERDVDPLTHEWVIEAKKEGQFEYSFDWQVTNSNMQPIETSGMSGSVEMDRAKFSRRCATAHQIVDGKYDYVVAYTKDLARMYGQAWRAHTGALKGANERRQLIADLIISGSIAFVTGGAGGVIGKWVSSRFVKDSLEGAFMGDAVKDLFKDTTRRLGRAGIQPPKLAAFAAFPTDPSDWQNLEEARVFRESGNLKLIISSWSDAAENREFMCDFDPVEEVEKRLKVAGVGPEQLGTPDEKEVFKQEKGFWKEWLSHYAHELQAGPVGYGGTRWSVDSNLDKPIKERVQACAANLGESGKSWIAQWAAPLEQQLEEEADKRNEHPYGF